MPLLTSFLSFPCLTVLEGPLSWLGQETVSAQVSGVLFPEQKAVEKTELVGGIYSQVEPGSSQAWVGPTLSFYRWAN